MRTDRAAVFGTACAAYVLCMSCEYRHQWQRFNVVDGVTRDSQSVAACPIGARAWRLVFVLAASVAVAQCPVALSFWQADSLCRVVCCLLPAWPLARSTETRTLSRYPLCLSAVMCADPGSRQMGPIAI